MEKHFLKTCSILLVIVLLVNMLPMGVFAEKIRENATGIESAAEEPMQEAPEEIVPEDAYVVAEIAENRSAFSKEFLLSNGLHMAMVYADAVHYETENGWEEIDNRLTANPDGTYSNTAGVWDITFPAQLSKNESIFIKKDGYSLSFSMSGELTTGLNATAQAFTITDALVSSGEIQQIDTTAMLQAAKYPEAVPSKLQSQITYANVYQNTYIVYDLNSNTVKESMILESYHANLLGYRYTLEVGSMIPVLEEDGAVSLYDENRENIVMVMPAPYLIDSNGEYNYDIEVQLAGKGSTYVLAYLLPQSWLAAADRAWPVLLDPIIQADLDASNIRDRTVAEKKTYAQDSGTNLCGWDSDTGIMRSYIKYNNLPPITSSDVVLYAELQMLKYYESSTTTPVEVHKVTGSGNWDSSTITWANKPGFNSIIEDYAIVDEVGWYGWVITDIVRDWYATANTGILFKASNAIETGNTANFKSFLSSDYGTENSRPMLSIFFRNNNGLESYWDYTTASAGRAGAGYVNNYTGNLTWVRNDIGFGGNRMPVAIQHIYNLNDTATPNDTTNANDSSGNSFGMGTGWRTNFNQLIYQWNLDNSHYIWEDGDGTDHYFKLKDGKYQDEDGLELTLTIDATSTQKYCITDKNGNCSYFDTYGRLVRQTNNQATKSSITITYTGTTKRIATVTDGVGRVYSFTYNGSNLLTRISYKGSGATELSHVSFGYTGTNLTSVTDKDGKASAYTYDTKGLLKTASDIDGYKLTYTYNTVSAGNEWQPYRVQRMEESDGSAMGGVLTFTYTDNETKITDYNGNTETYQFNDFGNTVSVRDDEGRAQFAQYARTDKDDTAGKANQLKVASKLQNTVGSLLPHGSFETGHYWASNSSSLTIARSTEAAYHGNYSLKLTSTSTSLAAAIRSSYAVAPGETYTFSAYVKSVDASGLIALYYSGAVQAGAHFSAGQDWKRLQITYTNNTTASVTVSCCLFTNSVGTAYMDCVQFEQAAVASRFNLVENSNFYYSGSPANSWSGTGLATTDTITATETAAPQLGGHALQITGNPTGYKQASQNVYSSGSAGDTYVFSGWAKGNSVPILENGSRSFALSVTFNNTDGTYTRVYAHFNPDVDTWQYAANVAVADKDYTHINFIILYNFNANTAYFDGIQLYKETFGNTYTYDDKGNVISVKDLQDQITTYQYDTGSNLTKIIQNGSAKMTYTYDSWHNVKTATTDEGLSYSFNYDSFGNNTAVSITSGGSTMKSTAVYTTNGNYLHYTKDALGKQTIYNYDANTGVLNWVQYPEDTAATRTVYTYDSMYRTASAACATDTGHNLKAEYAYTDDLLTQIKTPSTTYSFTYGDFALRTGVKIGNRTLATYHYTLETVNDRKYDLDRLDYGNNDRVQYEYDDQDRLIKQTYEDGAYVTYAYDNDGALSRVYDSQTGITTFYTYDLIGRLAKFTENGSGRSMSIGYTYDTRGNLTYLAETINGEWRGTYYTYDDDNRVTRTYTSRGARTYIYDAFGRIGEKQTEYNGSDKILENYTFTTNGSDQSAQVATHTVTTGVNTDHTVATTYTYTYDDNGNILSVSDGTYTTSYVYDSANQLIRENNQARNTTYYWVYDDAGNILRRERYLYTTGTPLTLIQTKTYTYGDSQWGDLLTSYDGKAITYDAIGNPLSDGTWNYTWQHGRQLAAMTNGTVTWNYTYDANGLRTSRSNGSTTYNYYYLSGQLRRMNTGSNKFYFAYDANGTPLTIQWNSTYYFYITNLQGDVIAITDSTGAVVVTYTYDAWGNVLSTSGSLASTLGLYNPLRYRGYVYDQETQLYYLQSRYYNPKTGRFLNADAYAATGQGFAGNNMFAYCLNNPVMYIDPTGAIPFEEGFFDEEFQEAAKWLYEFLTGREHPDRQAQRKNEEIIEKQNEATLQFFSYLWDAYKRSYELEQEAARRQAQLNLEMFDSPEDIEQSFDIIGATVGFSTVAYNIGISILAANPSICAIAGATLALAWSVREIIRAVV